MANAIERTTGQDRYFVQDVLSKAIEVAKANAVNVHSGIIKFSARKIMEDRHGRSNIQVVMSVNDYQAFNDDCMEETRQSVTIRFLNVQTCRYYFEMIVITNLNENDYSTLSIQRTI